MCEAWERVVAPSEHVKEEETMKFTRRIAIVGASAAMAAGAMADRKSVV